MLFEKNRSRIITVGAGLLALLFFIGCKKIKTKDPIVYNISAVMPHDGTPVSGVKFRIVEYKEKKGELNATGWEINGVTDAQGKASGSFMGIRKTNYEYYIYFDYSNITLPSGISEVSIDGTQYDLLVRSSPSENDYEIRVLPYTSMHFVVENVNCLNSNDKMRFKTFNYDEKPNLEFQYIPWGNDFDGCGQHVDYTTDHILAGHKVYLIEVIRNGVIDTTYIDTFNLLPNTMNEVLIDY